MKAGGVSQMGSGGGAPPARVHVLVAVSDPALRHSLSEALSDEIEVSSLADPGSAMAAIGVGHPDVVIVDGREATESSDAPLLARLKQHEKLCTVPVIVIADTDTDDSSWSALETGADDCLRRSFSPAELRARVRAADRLRRLHGMARAAEAEEASHDLWLAEQIQRLLLPREFELPTLEVGARMLTASEVGGDFYDVRPTPDGAWVTMGDVTGHGLVSGLLAMIVQSALAAVTDHLSEGSPEQVLLRLNQTVFSTIRDRMERDEQATMVLLRYFQNGRLLVAGGHEDMVLCPRGGDVRVIEREGPWLGASRNVAGFPTGELALAPGDALVLYTDGVIEARRGREPFGVDRLCAGLREVRSKSVEEICTAVIDASAAWCGGNVTDDMSVLVIRQRDSG